MIKLLKLVALLFAISFSLILIVRFGYKTESPPIATLFSDAQGNRCQQLCMIGVIVDSTPASDVPNLFAQHPLTRNLEMTDLADTHRAIDNNGSEFVASYPHYDVHALKQGTSIHIAEPKVTQMGWTTTAHAPLYRVSDVLQMFGQPDCVEVNVAHYDFYYSATKMFVSMETSQRGMLGPNDSITRVIIYGQAATLACPGPYNQSWWGFGSVQHYEGRR